MTTKSGEARMSRDLEMEKRAMMIDWHGKEN